MASTALVVDRSAIFLFPVLVFRSGTEKSTVSKRHDRRHEPLARTDHLSVPCLVKKTINTLHHHPNCLNVLQEKRGDCDPDNRSWRSGHCRSVIGGTEHEICLVKKSTPSCRQSVLRNAWKAAGRNTTSHAKS